MFLLLAVLQVPTLTPISNFGCEDCEGPLLFSSVQAIAVGHDGRIVVSDAAEPRVRVFDQRGSIIASFGRSGAGPGEFRRPVALASSAAGIEVVDMMQRRISSFGPNGVARSAIGLRSLALAGAYPPAGGTPLLSVGLPTDTTLLLQTVRADSLRDVLRIPASAFPGMTGHTSSLSIAVAPDGSFAVGEGSGAYLIRRYRADGTPVGEIRRDVKRVRRTPAEVAELTAARDRRLGAVAGRLSAEMGVVSVPITRPTVSVERNYFQNSALRYDEGGRLWVRTERAPSGRTLFDVFAPNGTFLGEVMVAADVGEFALGAGVLTGVVRDELEIQRIAVWQIR